MARWWEHPKMWQSEEDVGERKVAFLDLFYDLIFVVAIAQIAHGLAAHPDGKGLLAFAMMMLPLFWAWAGHTFYCDRFENREMSHLLYTFVAMLPIVGMAVFAHNGFGSGAVGFIASYVLSRVLLVFMYYRAGVHNEEGRVVWYGLCLGFAIGAMFWLASTFYEGNMRLALQVVGLLADLAVPPMLAKSMAKLPRFAEGRLRERFGLIMIIVLGESIAGTAGGLSDVHHLEWRHAVTAILAMIFAFGVFFTYFEMVPRERLKPGFKFAFLRTYLHFPLVLTVAATGAGVLATVGHEYEVLANANRMVLAGAIGLAYVTMIGLSRVHVYPKMGAGAKFTEGSLWVAAGLAAVVAFGGEGWSTLRVLAILAVSSFVSPLTGIYFWRKTTKHLPKQPDAPTQG